MASTQFRAVLSIERLASRVNSQCTSADGEVLRISAGLATQGSILPTMKSTNASAADSGFSA